MNDASFAFESVVESGVERLNLGEDRRIVLSRVDELQEPFSGGEFLEASDSCADLEFGFGIGPNEEIDEGGLSDGVKTPFIKELAGRDAVELK